MSPRLRFSKSPVLYLPAFAANLAAAVYSFLFPSGSASSIVESTDITITPIKHWNSQWQWWAVKHTDLAGQQPYFLVPKADHYNLAAGEILAVWATAADTDTWTQFTTVTIGVTNIEFQHGSAFTNKRIYIASLPLYPFSRTQRLVSEWDLDSRVTDTPSSASYILGYATARSADDGSGRTAPALPFYGLKITNASGFTKNKIVLMSANHPHETPGRFSLEGAVAWLLGGSAAAEFLLDWFEFYIYPCVNPQGVWAGYFRSCPEDKTLDHNRQWNTTGTLECIDLIKAAIAADTGGTVEVAIDYHAEISTETVFGYTYDNTTALAVAYAAKHAALEATYDLRNFTTVGTTNVYFHSVLSAALDLVLEQGIVNTRTITNYKNSGAYSLQCLSQMLADGRFTNNPGVGSRDFNGTTDRIDWSSIYNPTGQALTISAWVYLDRVNASQYFLNIGVGTGAGIVFNNPGSVSSGSLQLYVAGTTAMFISSQTGWLTTGAWIHVLATRTASFGNPVGIIKLYKNGAEPSSYINATTGSGESTASGSWSAGGRISDDLRNTDGKIAQVGVWSRVLTSTEIANLAAGQAPDLAAPDDLEFYFKGNTSSLDDEITSGTGTADGTTQVTGVGNGPSIIY